MNPGKVLSCDEVFESLGIRYTSTQIQAPFTGRVFLSRKPDIRLSLDVGGAGNEEEEPTTTRLCHTSAAFLSAEAVPFV